MGTVTYLNQEVVDLVNGQFIPVKVDMTKEKKRFNDFDVQWTPTLIVCDRDQKEHHRTTGYLSPSDFLSEMRLGLGNMEYHAKHFKEAISAYRQVLQAYPQTSAAPEALYFSGVCNYMATNDPGRLKETFIELQEKYPGNDWTKKAEVWS